MDLFTSLEGRKSADKAVKAGYKAAPEKAIAAGGAKPAPASLPQAVGPCARASDISSGRAKVGDEIVYRALFAGGYYRATVMAVRFKGGVDIDVFTDSGRRMLHLRRIPVADDLASCEEGQAYLGERPKS